MSLAMSEGRHFWFERSTPSCERLWCSLCCCFDFDVWIEAHFRRQQSQDRPRKRDSQHMGHQRNGQTWLLVRFFHRSPFTLALADNFVSLVFWPIKLSSSRWEVCNLRVARLPSHH